MNTPVWLLNTSFEPRGSSLYTLSLAEHLSDFGFEPTIVCESAALIPTKLQDNLAIREVPFLTRKLIGTLGLARLVREARDDLPALVHAQRRTLDTLALDLAIRVDCPYLVTVQDILPTDGVLSVAPENLARIIAVSPSVERDLVVGAGVPPDLVRMVPNGVEISEHPVLPPLRSGKGIPIVGTACALEPVKGIMYFLMAAELILSSGHDVEFMIAGSGPEEETLRRAAQVLDIANRVTFVEHVREPRQVLELFDVFVIPSIEQGLGTIMIEAMALGKPVVATRVGGIADFFVNEKHALLIPPANQKALADKIKFLLDNPDKARRLAANGQSLVRERFSAERMTRQTAQLYRDVLERWQATRSTSEAEQTPLP